MPCVHCVQANRCHRAMVRTRKGTNTDPPSTATTATTTATTGSSSSGGSSSGANNAAAAPALDPAAAALITAGFEDMKVRLATGLHAITHSLNTRLDQAAQVRDHSSQRVAVVHPLGGEKGGSWVEKGGVVE